jgi:predicted nuclease of predicted toxin-antitoxin system
VKLLFDNNLSPYLVERLADLYPDCVHVSHVGLERALDAAVWSYARKNALTVVTKDADFGEMSVLRDSPPKVIWLRSRNCSTRQIETILRALYEPLVAFHNDPKETLITLFF